MDPQLIQQHNCLKNCQLVLHAINVVMMSFQSPNNDTDING